MADVPEVKKTVKEIENVPALPFTSPRTTEGLTVGIWVMTATLPYKTPQKAISNVPVYSQQANAMFVLEAT